MSNNLEVTRKIRSFLSDIRSDFSLEEITLYSKKPSGAPKFPTGLIVMALLKDVFDLVDLTLIGVILTTVFAVIVNVIIFLWMFKKLGFSKKIIYRASKYIALGLVEFIPFLKIIPTTVVLVLLVHKSHTKAVQLIIKTTNYIEQILKKEGPGIIEGSRSKTLSRLNQRKLANEVPLNSNVFRPKRTRQERIMRINKLPKAA